jgi:hypothetical protein
MDDPTPVLAPPAPSSAPPSPDNGRTSPPHPATPLGSPRQTGADAVPPGSPPSAAFAALMSPVKTDACSADSAPDLPVAPAGFMPPAALSRAMLIQVECVASIWPAFAYLRAAASASKPSRLRLVVSAMVCDARLIFAASECLLPGGAG